LNLTSLQRRIQRKVGLAAATAGDEQTLVQEWADEAALKFLQKTKAVKQTAVMAMTAGQGDYNLDASILSFEDVWIEPNSGGLDVMLQQVDSYDVRRLRLAEGTVASPPAVFAYDAGILMVYPAPQSSSDELHIVYVEKPSGTFVAGGGTESWVDATRGNIPTQYHDVLEAYVSWKASEYSNDAPSKNGESYRAQWEAGVMETKMTESRRAGMVAGRARIGRPGLSYPIGNGVDIRYL
jgi:hypothetical protein